MTAKTSAPQTVPDQRRGQPADAPTGSTPRRAPHTSKSGPHKPTPPRQGHEPPAQRTTLAPTPRPPAGSAPPDYPNDQVERARSRRADPPTTTAAPVQW